MKSENFRVNICAGSYTENITASGGNMGILTDLMSQADISKAQEKTTQYIKDNPDVYWSLTLSEPDGG